MATYKSNAKKVIGRISDKLEKLEKVEVDKTARIAALTLQASIANRVFQDGEASNEGLIGNYSTKDMLIGAKSFIRKTEANKMFGSPTKRRKLQWVTVKGKHLAVLPGGYAALRTLQGRQANRVDLHMTGKLLSEWSMEGRGKRYFLGFRGEYGKNISEAMETKYKKPIFKSTDTERKQIVTIFEQSIFKQLK